MTSFPICWQFQSGSTCVYTRNACVLPIWRRTQSGNLDRGSIKPICCQNQSACGEIGSSHCLMQSTGHGRALTHALHPRAAPTRCKHALCLHAAGAHVLCACAALLIPRAVHVRLVCDLHTYFLLISHDRIFVCIMDIEKQSAFTYQSHCRHF